MPTIVIALQIAALLLSGSLGPESTGTASQYAPGRMAETIANRQAGLTEIPLPAELPQVNGYIAVMDCNKIGELWLVKPENKPVGLFLVVDCACPGDGTIFWMLENNIIMEVDHETARKWDTVGGGIKVQAWEFRLP